MSNYLLITSVTVSLRVCLLISSLGFEFAIDLGVGYQCESAWNNELGWICCLDV